MIKYYFYHKKYNIQQIKSMSSDSKLNIDNKLLSEAKEQYTNQLIMYLNHLYNAFEILYKDSIKDIEKKLKFKSFQQNLKKIRLWNQEIINQETKRIIKNSKCDFLDDLLTAIFVTNAKILLSVRNEKYENKKLKINVPRLENFIHKTYINISRIIFKNPFILMMKYL